jgi:DNA-directed RNA polymerase specialized sigma24 family protein
MPAGGRNVASCLPLAKGFTVWYTLCEGACLFNFDREFPELNSPCIVATEGIQRNLQQTQRDIFDSHRHRAFSLAFYMTGNEVEAEQILTTTFIRAFQTAAEPDAGIVDCALVSELRSRFPLGQPEPAACPSVNDGLANRRVRRTDLEEAIQHLPATERLLFLLSDVEGYSCEAVSELIEIPQAQVKRRLFSARIRLRQILSTAAQSQAA